MIGLQKIKPSILDGLNKKISGYQGSGRKFMYKARVLLVEDMPLIQAIHMRMLEKLNCEIDLAKNGKEALNLYQKNKYDLILLDIGLPGGMSGIEICKFIREQKDEVPIIALTACGIGMKEQCIDVGMDDFLEKPVSKEILQSVLIRWVPSY